MAGAPGASDHVRLATAPLFVKAVGVTDVCHARLAAVARLREVPLKQPDSRKEAEVAMQTGGRAPAEDVGLFAGGLSRPLAVLCSNPGGADSRGD